MNEVFDANELPGRMLSARKMVAVHSFMPVGDAVRIVQMDLARQLAATILEGEPFFWERGTKMGAASMLEYGADCIVLTREEYATLKRKSFEDGVAFMQGLVGVTT